MKRFLSILSVLALITACDRGLKTQYSDLAKADSLRTDSIVQIKNEMLNEVMASTQFVNDLNTKLEKLKAPTVKLNSKLTRESALEDMKSERAAVTQQISELVARLDSSQARLASLRERAKSFADRDSLLEVQVAEYETTIDGLRKTLDDQRAQFQATVDQQNKQIATLNLKIDTVTQANSQLTTQKAALITQKAALTDTVGQLTSQMNAAYYIAGTRDDLLKQGIVVEEGRRSFFIVGSRNVVPARGLDSTKFTRIDRQQDRLINLPDGEYTILSRQNSQFATPVAVKDGKITGGLRIDQPDKFWGPSKYLVMLRD